MSSHKAKTSHTELIVEDPGQKSQIYSPSIELKWNLLTVHVEQKEDKKKKPDDQREDSQMRTIDPEQTEKGLNDPLLSSTQQSQPESLPPKSNKEGDKNFKKILDDATGFCKTGELMAIMGPSGAGKTTLMAMISQRMEATSKQSFSGECYMNGSSYNQAQFQNNAAFIMQNDILLQTMTVFECLQFSAYMRLNANKETKDRKVENIIRKLQLQKCRNTYIGGQFVQGVSGGERKRVCIGVELVSEPSLILLDEPTSGLDSFTAFLLVNLLKEMTVKDNKTIIMTIHQPSADIFALIDRLLLLKNGQEVYQGRAQDILKYLNNVGIQAPDNMNIPDFFMQLLQKEDHLTRFNHQSYKELQKPGVLEEYYTLNNTTPIADQMFRNNFTYEFKMIARRAALNFVRNPYLLQTKVIQFIFTVFFMGSIWWQSAKVPVFNQEPTKANIQNFMNHNVGQWLQNVGGFLFSLGMSVTMQVIGNLTLVFPSERGVFLKEYNSSTYRVISYFVGKMVIEIPQTMVFPVLQLIGLYPLIALSWGNGGEKFFTAALILIFSALVANGLGTMNGSLFSNIKTASAMTMFFILPFMLFGGFYSNLGTIPVWASWIQYISVFKYQFEALNQNQYNNLYLQVPIIGGGTYPVNMEQAITTKFDFNIGLWNSITILLLLAFFFHFVAYFFLRVLVKKLSA